jgi:uncharacterized protein
MDNGVEAITVSKLLPIISNEFLELIILPTEQCNFRCTYCYEDFSLGKMKQPIVDGIKKLMSIRASELKILKISWFGGEPLAAKDIVFEIAEHAMQLKDQHLGLVFQSAMTTNGYHLNPEMLKRLCKIGVNEFQISLDGPKEVHNKSRIRADGKGTYDKIWDNLLLARNTNIEFKITLRVHVTPDNLLHLPQLIADINLHFKNDVRFTIFFKSIENLGGPNSKTFQVLHKKDKAAILSELYNQVDSSIFLEKVENTKPYICYAAQGNSFLIRSNGRLGKCTVALSDDRNDIGCITPAGELSLDNEKLRPWIRGISNFNLKNLECPMYDFPSATMLAKHNIAVKIERG